MKRSKKLVSVSLLVLMLGLITACGSRNAADNNGTGNTTNDNNAAGITDTGVNGNTTNNPAAGTVNESNTNNTNATDNGTGVGLSLIHI